MSTVSNWAYVVLGLLLAIGIAAAGFFISHTMSNSQTAVNTAEVKGLAERRVKADRANWSIGLRVASATNPDIKALYKRYEDDQAKLVVALKAAGFDDDEITVGVADYNHRQIRNAEQVVVENVFSLSGTLSVETNKVDKIAAARGQVNKLLAEGVELSNYEPGYHFTKLNDIKPEMIKEATQAARIAATQFAENVEAKVGGIRSARQGGFSIRDAGSDHGDRAKIDKDVRVVSTISFYLTSSK